MLDLCWLPAHPADGSTSMDRYWWSLASAAEFLPPDIAVGCPLGAPKFERTRSSRWARFWQRRVAYPALVRRTVQADVAHILDHSTAYLLPHLPKSTHVVATVHDLIPLQTDVGLSRRQQQQFRQCVEQLRRATLLVAVSQYTSAALQSVLGIPADRIVVIPNGVDEHFYQASAAPPPRLAALEGIPLVLSIGSAHGRKNLQIFPAVLRELRREFGEIGCVRVGAALPAPLREQVQQAIGASNLVELGFVPDEKLPSVYQAASVLLFPSHYEGFGLPLIEALAAGCPVASSTATSLPEVGGDAVAYFDPLSPSAAAEAVASILRDPIYREDLICRGRARALQFSWRNHIEQLAHAYRYAATGEQSHLDACCNFRTTIATKLLAIAP